ncbi:cell surface glycoprotein CD200 receptor 1-A-like [Eleutherodactylus coqui]|uniref:Ig-like domain-containing protein n=1 Tax=Eleutherodactylus coqui TaxID=57060 RepID=A0A8J6BJH8_ELECQ|nr:hypothetical protein GDO78_016938 [Eleutherodactylus coqui]
MKSQEKAFFTFLLFLLVCLVKVKSDVLTVHVGDDAVLHCSHSIEHFALLTWKVNFLNQSSCFMSTSNLGTQANCSSRMQLVIDKNQTSLRINNSMVLDDGNYTCEIAKRSGTFDYMITLQILAKPFVSIKIDGNGYPECRAIGGKPAAKISWTPESYKVKTWNNAEQNGTTTVISSYNTSNGPEVTCIVSHPTLANPLERRLSSLALSSGANNVTLILGVIIVLVLLLGLILVWRRANLRTCLGVKKDRPATRENPVVVMEEVEPYASFTVKVNTIYNSTYDLAEYKGAQ